MFINDVGQNTWEEINDGIAGSNYGWPNCEGFCNPPNPSFRDPIFAYMNDGSTCAITGGAFYNPQIIQFPSNFVGNYFVFTSEARSFDYSGFKKNFGVLLRDRKQLKSSVTGFS